VSAIQPACVAEIAKINKHEKHILKYNFLQPVAIATCGACVKIASFLSALTK